MAKYHYENGIRNLKYTPDATVIFCQAAIRKDSLFCDAYILLSEAYLRINNYDSALITIEKALKINQNFLSLYLKGELLTLKQSFTESFRFYSELCGKQPENIYWKYFMAKSLVDCDSLDLAGKEITGLIWMLNNKNLDNSPGYYLWGKLCYKQSKFEAATKQFETAKTFYDNDPEFNYLYGMSIYLSGRKINSARKYLLKAYYSGYKINDSILQEMKI